MKVLLWKVSWDGYYKNGRLKKCHGNYGYFTSKSVAKVYTKNYHVVKMELVSCDNTDPIFRKHFFC